MARAGGTLYLGVGGHVVAIDAAASLDGRSREHPDLLPCIEVTNRYRARPILVPLQLDDLARFTSLVERYAGPQHPLAVALREAEG